MKNISFKYFMFVNIPIVMLLLFIFYSNHAQSEPADAVNTITHPSLYIRNQPYNGTIITINNFIYGELPLIAPMIKLHLIHNNHSYCLYKYTDKESPCPPDPKALFDTPALYIVKGISYKIPVKEQDSKIFVPLSELAKIVGAKYLYNDETGIIDIAFRTLVIYDPNEPKPTPKKEEYDSKKKSASSHYEGKLSLLFVYQPGCPKCDTLSPILEELQRNSNGRIKLTPINVLIDKETDPYDRYLDALVGKKENLITPGLILYDETGKILKTEDGLNISSRTTLDKWLGRYKI